MKNEFLNLTREELIKECTRLNDLYNSEYNKNILLQEEVKQEDEIIADLLGCGVYDVKVINKYFKICENHNIYFEEVIEYIENNFGQDYKKDFGIIVLSMFEMLLTEFQKELKIELEKGKDYNLDLNYYCSDIYFTDDKLQDKFDKWL